MRINPTSALLCLALACSSSLASAQPEPEPTEAVDPKARALLLFNDSKIHYQRGEFAEAARKLEESHALHAEPVLLYNLARAYEGLGDLEKAADAYSRYLDDAPNAKDRGAIEQKVINLRARVAERKRLVETAQQVDPEPLPAPQPPADTAPSDDGLSPWPWVIAGAGVSGVVVGAVLGAMASGKHSDAEAESSALAAQDLQSSAEDLSVGANLTFIVGGLVAAVGVAWVIADLSSSDDDTEVTLAPDGLRGRF